MLEEFSVNATFFILGWVGEASFYCQGGSKERSRDSQPWIQPQISLQYEP